MSQKECNSKRVTLSMYHQLVYFILQYFQICSEGCPEAVRWSDLIQDVADTELSDSLVQERNRGCADQYEEYEDLAYQ